MQRAYREDMQLQRCGSNRLPKAVPSRGKQTSTVAANAYTDSLPKAIAVTILNQSSAKR